MITVAHEGFARRTEEFEAANVPLADSKIL